MLTVSLTLIREAQLIRHIFNSGKTCADRFLWRLPICDLSWPSAGASVNSVCSPLTPSFFMYSSYFPADSQSMSPIILMYIDAINQTKINEGVYLQNVWSCRLGLIFTSSNYIKMIYLFHLSFNWLCSSVTFAYMAPLNIYFLDKETKCKASVTHCDRITARSESSLYRLPTSYENIHQQKPL